MRLIYRFGIILLFLLALLPSTIAIKSDPQNISYINMSLVKNKITIDARGLNNFTNTSSVLIARTGTVPYNISNAEKGWGEGTSADKYIYRTTEMNYNGANWRTQAWTFGCWVNTKSLTTGQYVVNGFNNGARYALCINCDSTNKFECSLNDGGWKYAVDNPSTNVWHLMVCKWDTKNVMIYRDGIFRNGASTGATIVNATTGNYYIGSNGAGTPLLGNVTGCQWFNGNLTNTQIQTWYNYGNPFYQATTSPITGFKITAKNEKTNPFATIYAFNVTINSSTYNKKFYTTNGTINTDIMSNKTRKVNITMTAYQFFTKTQYNYNTSKNLQMNLTPYASFKVNERFNGSRIPSWWLMVNGVKYSSNSSGIVRIPFYGEIKSLIWNSSYHIPARNTAFNTSTSSYTVNLTQAQVNMVGYQAVSKAILSGAAFYTPTKSGTMFYLLGQKYNFTGWKQNWYNKTQEYTLTSKMNVTLNISDMYNIKLNVTPYAGSTATKIAGVTINISYWNSTYKYSRQTTASGYSTYFGVINGTYKIWAIKPGVYIQTATKNVTPKSRDFKFNISLFQWNTFNISTRIETTLGILTNTSYKLYGLSSGYYNYTNMLTGKDTKSLLVPDLYTFIYKDNPGAYSERFRYITLVNGTFNELSLYLLPTASGDDVTITLQDEVSTPLSGYIVAAYKFIPATGQYIIVESQKTDEDGKAKFKILRGNEQYKWYVIKDNVVIYSTELERVLDTTRTITVTLGASNDFIGPTLEAWQLRTRLIFNNVTKIFFFQWYSLSSSSGTICWNITQSNWTQTNHLYGECKTATNGNMTYNATGKAGTLTAVAYIKGSTFITNILTIENKIRTYLYQIFGTEGSIVYLILIIAAATMMVMDIAMIPFVIGIIMLICQWIGLIHMGTGVVIATIAAILLASFRLGSYR